jgi:hypothetical protein
VLRCVEHGTARQGFFSSLQTLHTRDKLSLTRVNYKGGLGEMEVVEGWKGPKKYKRGGKDVRNSRDVCARAYLR